MPALDGGEDALKSRKCESLIIHGAAGGVGTLAPQFAKTRGARVLAVASGADGVALVRKLGGDAAVDGHDESAQEKKGACALQGDWWGREVRQ